MKQTIVDPIPCFIPQWTNAINFAILDNDTEEQSNSSYISNKFNMDYGNSSSCLVGEAHTQNGKGMEETYFRMSGYVISDKQICRTCINMSEDKAELAMVKGGDALIKFKVILYNHMVQDHKFKGNIIDITKVPKVGKC